MFSCCVDAAGVEKVLCQQNPYKRQVIMEGKCVITICEGELVNVANAHGRVQDLQIQNEALRDSVSEWQGRYTELQAAQQQLFEEMEQEYQKREQPHKQLRQAATEFMAFGRKGKTYSEVGTTQQQRQRHALQTRTEKALWFAKSFGFNIEFLHLRERQTNEEVHLHFSSDGGATAHSDGGGATATTDTVDGGATASVAAGGATAADGGDTTASVAADGGATAQSNGAAHSSTTTHSNGEPLNSAAEDTAQRRYIQLSDEEKDAVKKTLFILDRFSGSDSLYHELTQIYPTITRSYMVWHYRRRFKGQGLQLHTDKWKISRSTTRTTATTGSRHMSQLQQQKCIRYS